MTTNFTISDILLSTISNKHPLYDGPMGQELMSLIWDLYQVNIMQSRTAGKTPLPKAVITEIRSHLHRIIEYMPNSKLATFIKNSPDLRKIITEPNPAEESN